MIRALYTAASGMMAQETNLDNIANNLANSSTAGFRRRRLQFEDLVYQNLIMPGAAASQQTTMVAGLQVGLGTRSAASEVIQLQGDFSQTGNPLDLTIQGQGFFQVLLPDGETAYTRAGSFHLDAQGNLVTQDGNAFMRTALARMVASESGFEVVGTACDGAEALERIAALDPDVVTLDVEMPGQNGVETLRRIMNRFPRPVIMVSAATEKDAEATFNALGAGAFDYVPKQMSPTSLDIMHIRPDLIAKIRAASLAHRASNGQNSHRKPARSSGPEEHALHSVVPAIVAMGTSTGGPNALQEILPRFPQDLMVPILIVQHMPPGFTTPFAHRLNSLCTINVREAVDGERVFPGVAYIAPAGKHMTVDRITASNTVLRVGTHPKDLPHVPSVDVLMQSVAEQYRTLAMGVILTGMGSDGVEGMTAIHRWGGLTIGQDESTCTVYGMPRACAALGILRRVVPLSQIHTQILQATHYRKRA